MPTRIKSDSDLFVQNELDIAATANDGTESGKATRLGQINPDLGLAQTKVATDGDLRTIDTAAERLATDPTANLSGAASAAYSSNFLLRWGVSLLQAITGRLPSALGSAAASASIPVVLANDSLIEVVQTIVRPSDTTAYAANDTIASNVTAGSVINPTFADAARAVGGGGYIVGAFCQVTGSTFNTAIRLHLFKAAPTAIADNAVYTVLAANNANRIGYIDFSSFTSGGSGSDQAIAVGTFPSGNALPYRCGASATSIFAMIEARAGFTPTSAQNFRFQLLFERS